MAVETRPSSPYDDQKAGTAGLRKRVAVFRQAGYLENYLQAIFDAVPALRGGTLLIGGDGRFHNDVAIRTAAAMAVANGVARVLIGRDGLMSTPSASSLIRAHGADGGIVFTASHNPAGPDGDFGIKFNMAGGGQATAALTEDFYRRSLAMTEFRIEAEPGLDLSTIGTRTIGETTIEVIDPLEAYADQMAGLFDFPAMRDWLAAGHRVCFDAMHAVTGPYAREILCRHLGAPDAAVINADPLPDFGGGHPDPNLIHARELVETAFGADAPDLCGASDGDGDRNMILGPGLFVSPGDSLAMLAANLDAIPAYAAGLAGAARSMPTSRAIDAVAAQRGFECHETPTGWKFFCNLLDAGRATICGEESFGTSSNHTREKDGLWAFLAWLNVLAARDTDLPTLARAHWREFGRHYYQRHDYEGVDAAAADVAVSALRERLVELPDTVHDGWHLTAADDFAYTDPVDGSQAESQGLRLCFGDRARIVLRLSGTGTSGATIRLYLERYEAPDGDLDRDPAEALAPLAELAEQLIGIRRHTGRDAPSVIT